MKYITAEQFLQADKKVQDSIMKWWKPEVGDLVESSIKDEVWCLVDKIQVNRVLNIDDKSFVIPLLTLQQLIDYIGNRCGLGIAIDSIADPNKNSFEDNKVDLLRAMWELAQKVGK